VVVVLGVGADLVPVSRSSYFPLPLLRGRRNRKPLLVLWRCRVLLSLVFGCRQGIGLGAEAEVGWFPRPISTAAR
jgi:hypothetical protein